MFAHNFVSVGPRPRHTYADAFLVIMAAFVFATALVPFLRNGTPKAPPPDAH
ncbi:hypothetical protein RFM68_19815 [Mesorhizobium sp. MSK_1335]|uniref:Uncharacterized protein n=1 Tax=Mesorhizobium montanum TaxID=3072323 RepID=A0ABU4ZQZ6_9HYPH|nr:hypothetical protein [Mesorhizobium sp. MSK_1335]MDX8526749.1 hypothetical protein [Mesorhizobium sp. MSK_1335]